MSSCGAIYVATCFCSFFYTGCFVLLFPLVESIHQPHPFVYLLELLDYFASNILSDREHVTQGCCLQPFPAAVFFLDCQWVSEVSHHISHLIMCFGLEKEALAVF